jgi:signal transduction histidine kinase/ActR/RegA family two-component response regulator
VRDLFPLQAVVAVLGHLREPLLLASASGQILAANVAAAEALGASAEALVGGSLADYSPDPAGLPALDGPGTDRPFPVRSRAGKRFVCDRTRIADDVLLLRLSGGPDATPRTRVFLDAMGGAGADEPADSRLDRLLAFTRVLARAITTTEVAEAVVDMGLAATFARGGGLWLRSADGLWVCLARSVGAGVPRPEDFDHVPLDREVRMPILDAIRDGSPVWIESCAQMEAQYPEVLRAFSRGGESALACVPLLSQGRCIGGLTHNYEGARTFGEDERAFLQVIAWHSAQAIERSRLYAAEKRAREAAESGQRRSEFLARASKLLTSSMEDEPPTLASIPGAAVPHVADWCIVELAEDRLRGAPALVAHVEPEKVPLVRELGQRLRAPGLLGYGISRVLQSAKSELHRAVPLEQARAVGGPELASLLAEIGIGSSILVPITVRKSTLGVIVLASSRRVYDEDDLAMAEDLGRRAGLALDNARLYRDAREADRQKDEFLAMLSHELRNPLAPIVSALDVMSLGAGGAFARERSVIQRHVEHVVRLVDDLLDVARMTRGKVRLHEEPSEVAKVIAKAVEMVVPLIDGRAQGLTIDVPASGIPVMADPARLAQAIANLLENASKYTPLAGAIAITARPSGSEAVIRVIDSGIGIAAEALPRIFDLFAQEARALDRAGGGLGIGLTVVKELVALHGGSVSAESEGPGRGSAFIVRLPLASLAPVERATPAADPAAERRRAGALRVLLVDDNVDAADMVATALEVLGHAVRVAFDGPSALADAPDFKPDVALVDIGLPGMDGYELAGRLRRLDVAPIRLIAVTGYGQDRDFVRTREAGFEEHLVKPVNLDALREVLERMRGSLPAPAVSPSGTS